MPASSSPSQSDRRFFPIAMMLALALGAAIRLWQFALNPSLWMDEASLSINIVGRDFAHLLKPLDLNQAAPLGFLFGQRAVLLAFGNNEYALRLLPLLFGLAALPLFWVVARRTLSGPGLLAAATLFALSPKVIFHTVEAKQYSGDVFAALLATWIGHRLWDASSSWSLSFRLGILGAALLLISHPAALVLGGVALCLLVSATANGNWAQLRRLAPALGIWLVTVAGLYAFALRDLTHDAFFAGVWSTRFAPFPPSTVADWQWYGGAFRRFFDDPLGLRLIWYTQLALLAGTAALAWLDRRAFFLLGTPFVLTLAASMLHRYPFSDRLVVFLVPGALIAIGAGITALSRAPHRLSLISVGVAVLLVAEPVIDFARAPFKGRATHEIRPVMQGIAAQLRPGDSIYVYGPAWAAFAYYAPRCGLSQIPCFVRDATKPPDIDTQRLVGRGRVWVLFSHVAKFAEPEHEAIVKALDRLGPRLSRIQDDGAWAYLYQLEEDGK